METILNYLETMFQNMPQTADVQRAKEELASMMEDKYTQLVAEGKKENEAVGIVISEFGNLDELAQELGISGLAQTQNVETARRVSRAEAEEFMALSKKTTKGVALGVLLCICSVMPLMILGGLSGADDFSDTVYVTFGMVPLFILVAIAVGLFIYNGMKMEKFEYLKKEVIVIDAGFERILNDRDEEIKPAATMKTIAGISFCILGVIPLLILPTISDTDLTAGIAVCILFVCIAIGVTMIIIGNSERDSIKVLLQREDYSKDGKNKNQILSVVSGIYWPLVTVGYLVWSFTTMNWGFTWIIWPVAGISYAAVAVVCDVIYKAIGNEMISK